MLSIYEIRTIFAPMLWTNPCSWNLNGQGSHEGLGTMGGVEIYPTPPHNSLISLNSILAIHPCQPRSLGYYQPLLSPIPPCPLGYTAPRGRVMRGRGEGVPFLPHNSLISPSSIQSWTYPALLSLWGHPILCNGVRPLSYTPKPPSC